MLSAEDLDRWEKVQPFERRADAIHEFDEAWIVGMYHLDQYRLCSYEDLNRDHEHRRGFCAWSRCDLLFLLGWDCAKKYIPRYDEWIRVVNDTTSLHGERMALEDAPIKILEILRALVASFERRLAGLENLRRDERCGRWVHEAMRHAHARPDLVVRFEVEDPETEEKEWTTKKLLGTAIFEGRKTSSRITLEDARSELRRAEAFANEATPDRANRDNFREFQKTRMSLRRFEAKLRQRLSDFEAFWAEGNLMLALIKTYGSQDDVPADVRVEGATIVVERPTRRVLRMEG